MTASERTPVLTVPVPGREGAYAKALRYLLEGRLTVECVHRSRIFASVRGSDRVHRCGWNPNAGWFCDCPAKTTCSHLHALQRVVVIPIKGEQEATR